MASGQSLLIFTPQHNEPPSSSYATPDTRNGHLVLDFDAAADESAIFKGILPRNYAGGGVTVTLHWGATSATSGTCRWATAFERVGAGGQDIDSDSFASANSTGGTADGTSGKLTATSIAHASGGEMDSLAAGETFRLKVTRDADGTSGTDDMAGDAELWAVEIRES